METLRTTLRPPQTKSDLQNRLKKIEGQVRGVLRMVDEDVYCDDILHQISAVQAALNSVGKQVLENHLHSCVVDRIRSGDDGVVDEFLVTLKALIK